MNALWRLQSVFREVFGDPTLKITEETSMSNFPEWDSVVTVQIVLATEAEFGIRFTTDAVASIRSVADILKLVENNADVK
jgi:acyl carrier protein